MLETHNTFWVGVGGGVKWSAKGEINKKKYRIKRIHNPQRPMRAAKKGQSSAGEPFSSSVETNESGWTGDTIAKLYVAQQNIQSVRFTSCVQSRFLPLRKRIRVTLEKKEWQECFKKNVKMSRTKIKIQLEEWIQNTFFKIKIEVKFLVHDPSELCADAAVDSPAYVHYVLFELAIMRPPLSSVCGWSFTTVVVLGIASSKFEY